MFKRNLDAQDRDEVIAGRRVARNLQSGGELFRRCKTKLKQFTLRIGPSLRPKLGEDQKKKVFARVAIEFCDQIQIKSSGTRTQKD